MKAFPLLSLLAVCGFIAATDAYRILAIFPFCGRSHYMMFDALTDGLLKRGHRVDIVTCFPPKKPLPNFHIITNVEGSQRRNVNNWNFSTALDVGTDTLPIIAYEFGNDLCKLMEREEIQKIIKNPPTDPPYDLVITEAFGANCYIGFGALLKVPVILVSTTIEFPWIDRALGNPASTAFFPAFFSDLTHPMSFWERVRNTVHDAISTYRYYWITGDAQNELMKKYFGPDIPDIRDLEKNVALALVNSYYTLTGVRPTTNALIEVGGLHVENNNAELTKDLKKWLDESKDGVVYFTLGSMDLKKWLDESKDGVVYFTLGSMVNIETMPDDSVKGLYAAFARIAPIRVLMKVANKERLIPGLPKNVITSSWIPQVPVLAHNNTRAFITHGGLMSTQESLYYGVPLIGIPLFGDQLTNLMYYKRKGMAIKLDFDKINERNMYDALNAVLNDPSYRNAAKVQSALFRDRPMSASDTAMFWVEYVIRNKPGILKSPATDLTWWQVALLDVYAFLLFGTAVAICFFVFIVKIVLGFIAPSKDSSMSKKRTKRD